MAVKTSREREMIVVRNVKVFKYGTIVEVFVTTLALPFHMKASWI